MQTIKPVLSLISNFIFLKWRTITFFTLSVLMSASASGVSPATDQVTRVNMLFDRASPPDRIWLWHDSPGGAEADPSVRGTDAWLCISATDPRNGACPMSSRWAYDWGERTPITLLFRERRSGITAPLTVTAYSGFYASPASHCTGSDRFTPANQSTLLGCAQEHTVYYYDGRTLSVYIDSQEIRRLPSGGIWEADLILRQHQWAPAADVARWQAAIVLDMTDRQSGDIFLTGVSQAAPAINIGLTHQTRDTISGTADIGACLYDGYNANSPWLSLTLSDEGMIPRRPAQVFSLRHDTGNTPLPRQRIDYRVTLHYNGQHLALHNGEPQRLNATSSAPVQLVTLPGMITPVACIPAALELQTVPFKSGTKQAGHYRGVLHIRLTADALAP